MPSFSFFFFRKSQRGQEKSGKKVDIQKIDNEINFFFFFDNLNFSLVVRLYWIWCEYFCWGAVVCPWPTFSSTTKCTYGLTSIRPEFAFQLIFLQNQKSICSLNTLIFRLWWPFRQSFQRKNKKITGRNREQLIKVDVPHSGTAGVARAINQTNRLGRTRC